MMNDLIKAIQTKLGLVADGDARGKTWTAIANALGATASASVIATIESIQRKLNIAVDGVAGSQTWGAIAKALGVEAPASDIRPPASGRVPQRAIDLILHAEGIDQPGQWPGGASGITLGYGYDLGFETTFVSDWKGVISDGAINSLRSALGLRGEAARRAAPGYRGIKITQAQALQVFTRCTLPQEETKTLKAFPGLDKMPGEVIGALVSLVFNRGASFDGERRAEMRNIRDLILRQATAAALPQADCLRRIAQQFRSMKRLWKGKGLDGLITRRENEAKLVEAAIS